MGASHGDKLNTIRNFPCQTPDCILKFSSQENLDIHASGTHVKLSVKLKAKEKLENEPKYPCEICGKLLLECRMAMHVKQVHSGRNFACDECPQKFKKESHLKIHKRNVHLSKRFKCPHCTKMFSMPQTLKVHVEGVHQKIKHPCRECDKSFSQSSDLRSHVKAVHRGIKSYCSVCNHEFLRASDRNRHERQVHHLQLTRKQL